MRYHTSVDSITYAVVKQWSSQRYRGLSSNRYQWHQLWTALGCLSPTWLPAAYGLRKSDSDTRAGPGRGMGEFLLPSLGVPWLNPELQSQNENCDSGFLKGCSGTWAFYWGSPRDRILQKRRQGTAPKHAAMARLGSESIVLPCVRAGLTLGKTPRAPVGTLRGCSPHLPEGPWGG
jgi:hypothetical protein